MDYRTAIYRFCNYQERSHKEVKDKLYELGAYTDLVNELLAELIEGNLLNEERFARSFVRGRFKIKHWGRVKIIQHLKQHRISEYLIKQSLKEIDANDYFATALNLGTRKWESLEGKGNLFQKKGKLYSYLLQKGFESSIIIELIQTIVI